MHVDSQQQPRTDASEREQDMQSMQTPDLTPREGVGRCYYTQLPRLVKVNTACHVHGCASSQVHIYPIYAGRMVFGMLGFEVTGLQWAVRLTLGVY